MNYDGCVVYVFVSHACCIPSSVCSLCHYQQILGNLGLWLTVSIEGGCSWNKMVLGGWGWIGNLHIDLREFFLSDQVRSSVFVFRYCQDDQMRLWDGRQMSSLVGLGRRVILTHDLTGTGLKGLVMCSFVGCCEYIWKFGFSRKWRIFLSSWTDLQLLQKPVTKTFRFWSWRDFLP